MPLLLVLCAAAFVSAFSIRLLDPLVPAIARDLGITVGAAAMLAPAYTFPYALSQPVLGGIGDALGKERIIKICLGLLALSLAAAAFAPNYATVFAARIAAGIAGGGIIPVAFAVLGDRVPVAQRQVALARIVMASQVAILLSGSLAGVIAVRFGWRWVFALAALTGAVAFGLMIRALPARTVVAQSPLSFQRVLTQYAAVLANPLARFVLAGGAIEGITLFGLLPFVADRLETRGLGGIEQAGLVLAAMSVGGLAYTLLVRWLLEKLGREWLIRTGGIISGLALAAIAYSPSWLVEAALFAGLGFGFFMIHNSLQALATELSPQSRASSVAVFAFCFFLGQALGPILYHFGFDHLGVHAPIVIAGIMLLMLAFTLAFVLQKQPANQT